jgi:hypothetical protein
VGIDGNERADKLAKIGSGKDHKNASQPYEHAHTLPHYYQRKEWPSMDETPDKGPIRFLAKYLKKHDLDNYLTEIANNFPNIKKRTRNESIDRKLSNEFWTNPRITDAQKTCLIKFRMGQYMGNFRKQLFFGVERFLFKTCSICNSTDPDTWLHVLLKCKYPYMHGLIVQRHNATVQEIKKSLLSAIKSRCLIYMNAGTFNNKPPENTVPPWLLPCNCNIQK